MATRRLTSKPEKSPSREGRGVFMNADDMKKWKDLLVEWGAPEEEAKHFLLKFYFGFDDEVKALVSASPQGLSGTPQRPPVGQRH